jgi:peroxiredoxin
MENLMLSLGTRVGSVDLVDTSGHAVTMEGLSGSAGVLLYFMRATTCPACNRHVDTLVRHATEFSAKGITVVIAVPEGADVAAAWKARRQLPFEVVTGPNGTPHEAFELSRRVFGQVQQSGTALIGRDGVVAYSLSSTIPTGSFDLDATRRALGALSSAS